MNENDFLSGKALITLILFMSKSSSVFHYILKSPKLMAQITKSSTASSQHQGTSWGKYFAITMQYFQKIFKYFLNNSIEFILGNLLNPEHVSTFFPELELFFQILLFCSQSELIMSLILQTQLEKIIGLLKYQKVLSTNQKSENKLLNEALLPCLQNLLRAEFLCQNHRIMMMEVLLPFTISLFSESETKEY